MKNLVFLGFSLLFLLTILDLQNFAPSLTEVRLWNQLSIHLSYKWGRLIPMTFGVIAIGLVWFTAPEFTFLAATTPWLVKLSLFDLQGILGLGLASLAVFAWKKNHKLWAPLLGLGVAGIIISRINWPNYDLARASFDVDQRVHLETQINDYQDIIPLTIKRLAYNKWFFIYLNYLPPIFNVFNWDRVFSPPEQNVTIASNLWGGKGFPDIFFWEIPIFIWLWHDKKHALWSLPIIIFLAFPFYHYFLFHELIWRDNRPVVEYAAVASVGKNHLSGPITLTGILDPLQSYYIYEYGQTHQSSITFQHFDATTEKLAPGYYIGFPGEFLGNEQSKNQNDFAISSLPGNMKLIDSFTFPDHVSFGNGDAIWTVEVN